MGRRRRSWLRSGPMQLSKYTTLIEIRDADCEFGHLVCNSLTGRISLIDSSCRDLLERARSAPPGDGHDSGVDGERLEYLKERGYLLERGDEETERLRDLQSLVERVYDSFEQFALTFRPLDEPEASRRASLTAIMRAIASRIVARDLRKYFLHAWVFSDEEAALLCESVALLDELVAPPLTRRPDREFHFVVATDGTTEMDFGRISPCFPSRKLLKFYVDSSRMDEFGGFEGFVRRVKRTMSRAVESGFTLRVYFVTTERNRDLVLHDLLDQFMVGGFFGTALFEFYLLPAEPEGPRRGFVCDFEVSDWPLVESLIRSMGRNPRYNLLHLFGGGVLHRYQDLKSLRMRFLPDPYYCPFTRNAQVFDLAGNIYACPRASVDGAEASDACVVGRYLPVVSLREEILGIWRARSISSIDRCRECSVSLICGGGCPYEALRKKGDINEALCQPVAGILEAGVSANMRSFLARFGPG